MNLQIGQKVAYPTQGVCIVEAIKSRDSADYYFLRVIRDNSTIFVPVSNAAAVGIRPVISGEEYSRLVEFLGADFEEVSNDWKIRAREFGIKLQSGNLFEIADVLKKLTFISREKKLSFREQSYLEKARFMIVSEAAVAALTSEAAFGKALDGLIDAACGKHRAGH